MCVVSTAGKREMLAGAVAGLLGFNYERSLWLILNSQNRPDLRGLCAQFGDSYRRRMFRLLADALAATVLAELDTVTIFFRRNWFQWR